MMVNPPDGDESRGWRRHSRLGVYGALSARGLVVSWVLSYS